MARSKKDDTIVAICTAGVGAAALWIGYALGRRHVVGRSRMKFQVLKPFVEKLTNMEEPEAFVRDLCDEAVVYGVEGAVDPDVSPNEYAEKMAERSAFIDIVMANRDL